MNTFEECFEDLDGYNEEHAMIKLVALRMSQSVVSLASFKGNTCIYVSMGVLYICKLINNSIINTICLSNAGKVRFFACTGTIVENMPSKMRILTSASLITCHKYGTKIADDLKVYSTSQIYSHPLLIYNFDRFVKCNCCLVADYGPSAHWRAY